MSIPSVYLKSDPSILGEINLKNFPYKPYELSILNQDFALNVYDINIQNNTVTFNNFIRYDTLSNKVSVFRNSAWNDITSSYFVSNNIYRVYKINVFQSVITSIKNTVSGTLFPSDFMMYDNPFTKQTPVITITRANGYYRFISDLGGTDFDENTGEPLRSVDTAGNFLPYVKFIVYKYDGYSQITSAFISDVDDKLDTITPQSSPNNWQDFWWDKDFISNMNLYVYNIGGDGKQKAKVNKIARKKNQPAWSWDIFFYAFHSGLDRGEWEWDRGVAFNLDGKPIASQSQIPGRRNEDIIEFTTNPKPSNAYRIYMERIAQKISPDNAKLVSMDFIKFLAFNQPISRDIRYQINNPSNQFQIQIPNDKPTNRIFVYQTNNNRLLHITDYIPKGTTQKVTINYTNNNGVLNVTSSVVPVNPLPVPQFIRDGNVGDYGSWEGNDNLEYNCAYGEIFGNASSTNICPSTFIYGECKNIYDENIKPLDKFDLIMDDTDMREGEVQRLKMYYRDEEKIFTCSDANKFERYGEYKCPNGVFSSIKQRSNGGDLTRLTVSCASLTIPKDYSDAITWSKNPINPIAGGIQGNNTTYVCRVNKDGYMYPGRYDNEVKQCYYHAANITSGGSSDFELASSNETLVWKDKSQVFNNKKIEGGINGKDGTVSYICRVKIDNNGNYNANGPNIAIGNETIDNDGILKCTYDYFGPKRNTTYELLSRQ